MLRLFVLTSITACAFGEMEGGIIGGKPTTIQNFPHQISLNYKKHRECGGSIISETIIVTAANCVDGKPIHDFEVQAGSTRLSEKGVRIAVKQAIIHEDFHTGMNNGIALVILAEPLQFSDSIKPISLPESGEEAKVGTSLLVSGWGISTFGGDFDYTRGSDILQYLEVNIVDSKTCSSFHTKGSRNYQTMICIALPKGGKGGCTGRGGPAISEGKLVGVVASAFGCIDDDFPVAYIRVSAFRDWIEKNRTDK